MTWTNNTAAAVSAGDPVLVGNLFCVALGDIAVGETGELAVWEVWEFPKLSTDDMAAGDVAYWDPANNEMTLSKGLAAGSPVAGSNTGDGTVTGVTLGAGAVPGTYTLTCTVAAVDGGTFQVMAPDGATLPDATVGAAYSNAQIGFLINDGATDFAVGDSFTIAVTQANSRAGVVFAPAAAGATTVQVKINA